MFICNKQWLSDRLFMLFNSFPLLKILILWTGAINFFSLATEINRSTFDISCLCDRMLKLLLYCYIRNFATIFVKHLHFTNYFVKRSLDSRLRNGERYVFLLHLRHNISFLKDAWWNLTLNVNNLFDLLTGGNTVICLSGNSSLCRQRLQQCWVWIIKYYR